MKNCQLCFCLLVAGLACSIAVAQESTEIEVTGIQTDEGPPTMIIASEESDGAGGVRSSMRVVSGDASSMAFVGDDGGFMSFGPGGGDDFSMLSNRSVQKDLELVGDQLEQIRDVQREFSKKMRDAVGDLSKGGFDHSRIEDLKQTIADMQQRKKDEINNLLLPHQQKRLQQVALQMKMKNRGTAKAIAQIADDLGLTEEQVDKMKVRAKELAAEIEAKTKKLKADAKEELLGMLSNSQRKKLTEMIGDEYKPSKADWNQLPGIFKKGLKPPTSDQ